MSAYTEIPKIKAENGELPPKVLGNLDDRYADRAEFSNVQDVADHLEDSAITSTDEITLWVHPNGDDVNGDGTEQNPYATLSHAITQTKRTAIHDSMLTLQLFPAVYSEIVALPQNDSLNYNIHIKGADVGGHPNVPTTEFRDVVGNSVIWHRNKNMTVTVEDVHFIDCAAPIAPNHGNIFTINVHATRCGIGVRNVNGNLDVKGGIFTDCEIGVYSLMVNRHAIGTQHAGNTDLGPWFINCDVGVRLQETVTGHVDYCLFEDCGIGINVNRGANLNPDGSEFYRNGTGILVQRNATALHSHSRPQVYGTGSDANGQNIRVISGGIVTGRPHGTGIGSGSALTDRLFYSDTQTRTLSGGGIETILSTTLDRVFWMNEGLGGDDPQPSMLFKITGYLGENTAGTSGVRTLSAGFTGTSTDINTALPRGGTGYFESTIEVHSVDSHNLIAKMSTLMNGQEPMIEIAHWNHDMTVNSPFRIRTRQDQTAHFMTVHNVQVWVRGL